MIQVWKVTSKATWSLRVSVRANVLMPSAVARIAKFCRCLPSDERRQTWMRSLWTSSP